MEVTGTKRAFLQMIKERGVYKKLGVSMPTVSNWKRNPNRVTLDKMEEMLLKYGATVIQEKIWLV